MHNKNPPIFQRRRGGWWKRVRWWRWWWWRDCHWRDSATTPTPTGGGPLKLKDKIKTRLNKPNAYPGVKHGRTSAGNQTSKGSALHSVTIHACLNEDKAFFPFVALSPTSRLSCWSRWRGRRRDGFRGVSGRGCGGGDDSRGFRTVQTPLWPPGSQQWRPRRGGWWTDTNELSVTQSTTDSGRRRW